MTERLSTTVFAFVAILMASSLFGCSGDELDELPLAPLLEGMGDHHHPITTDNPIAQQFFDQGLIMMYAFNHDEAKRSFQEAARIDPQCAMCYWGIAHSMGSNINKVMNPDDAPEAFAAIQKAVELSGRATKKEGAYIDAMAVRFESESSEDRSNLDLAYARAMATVAATYPDDADVLTMYAEALMILSPWDYWNEDGEPTGATGEFLGLLELAMEIDPDNPGPNHFWIHAVEAFRPELAIPSAERLAYLVPGAGHLVHMPAHIYLRTGRYHEATLANEQAIEADLAYGRQQEAQGIYPLQYMPHNQHFLWFTATMEGRRERALEAANHMAEHADRAAMRRPEYSTIQHFWVTPYYAMVRFGMYDEVLAKEPPPSDLGYPQGVWHYARGFANVRLGNVDSAASELEQLVRFADDPDLEAVTVWDLNTTRNLLLIAADVLAGEIALARGDSEAGFAALKRAVDLEDGLTYDEPPPWYHPVRQILAGALLEGGRYREAEQYFREDLERFPENGWSLYGLGESLIAQNRIEEAHAAAERFVTAWKRADFELRTARM